MSGFPVSHWGGLTDLIRNIDDTYGLRTTGLVGVGDGKVGTFATWAKISSANILYLAKNTGQGTKVLVQVSFGGFAARLEMKNADGTKAIDASGVTNTHIDGLDVWAWYGFSWNASAGRASMYLNDTDVQDHGLFFGADETIDYTVTDHAIYANTAGTAHTAGCFKHVFFSASTEYDFAAQSNRRLFISSSGKPVTPPSGANVFLSKGDPANNEGSGGDFVIINPPFSRCISRP